MKTLVKIVREVPDLDYHGNVRCCQIQTRQIPIDKPSLPNGRTHQIPTHRMSELTKSQLVEQTILLNNPFLMPRVRIQDK